MLDPGAMGWSLGVVDCDGTPRSQGGAVGGRGVHQEAGEGRWWRHFGYAVYRMSVRLALLDSGEMDLLDRAVAEGSAATEGGGRGIQLFCESFSGGGVVMWTASYGLFHLLVL